MEFTIEKTSPFYSNAESWYQAWLKIGDKKVEIGTSCFDYDDCRVNCERLVEEFSKKGIHILHSKIYDFA